MKKRFLRDIAEIQTGPFGSQLHKEDYVDIGTPIVTVEHLGSRVFSEQNLPMVSDADKSRLSKYVLKKGDIVFSRVGSVDRCSFVDQKHDGWMFSGRCLRVRPSEEVEPLFLYYFFCLNATKEFVRSIAVGATMPSINTKLLGEVEVVCPGIEEQRKIADILSKIDDKIEENQKINENLQQQAQALFKSWFLNYEPWNGTAPNSWLHGKLGDYANIKRGGSPRPIQEYLSDSGLRWLKISDVTGLQTPFIIDIKDHIIEEGLKKTVFLKAGSLVLSNSATPGVPKILDVDSCIHDGWLYFPESKFSNEYLYLYFKYIRQQLVNLSNGSVFNNLKTDILKGYPTILPDEETLQRFDGIIKPMFLQMQNLTRESHDLMDLRDTILPRLMSGELDVSGIKL